MHYQYATLDPRSNADNSKILQGGDFILGVEVTVPSLLDQLKDHNTSFCGNIDPQHGFHCETYENGSGFCYEPTAPSFMSGETAIEFASRVNPFAKTGWVQTMLPPPGATLVTVRADLDSVGTMATLEHISTVGEIPLAMKERIQKIADFDRGVSGKWVSKELPTKENPWPDKLNQDLSALAAAVADFKVPLEDRVATMLKWLVTGEEPEQYRVQVEKERQNMISALETGQIKYETRSNGRITVVESTHRAATTVGYSLAPVVIALNPEMRIAGGEPHKKFTICQLNVGYVDLSTVKAELNQFENGWGGSETIIGSPQGVSSKLAIEQVVGIVEKHLLK